MATASCGKSTSDKASPAAAQGPPDTNFFPLDSANQKQLAACPTGTSQHASEDGRETWCARPDGTRHGPWVTKLRCRGIVSSRKPYVDGQVHGNWMAWHTGWLGRGELMLPYDDGVCDMLQLAEPPTGPLMRVRGSVYPYRRGKRHGLHTAWWSNGRKSSEGAFQGGAKHGTWRMWDRAGKLLGEYTMNRGTGTERWAGALS